MPDVFHDEYEVRKTKLRTLQEKNVHPYPSTTHRTSRIQDFLERFEDFQQSASPQTLAGRIRLKRAHGKILFFQIQDESGFLQLVYSLEELSSESFSLAEELYDVGDIIEVTGLPFVTKRGERSLLVSEHVLLAKALRPLPNKWHGIADEELRYRKRYIDMFMNPELREMFKQKSRFWNSMRLFLREEGFLEVETPVLETTPGGADAEPFTTHHNALDIDLYLRISMGELWQKRLMIAGFEKTFEIGRQFRNEGMSPEHLQDYTQMEFYWAYADYRDTMKLVERMYKHCIMETFGTLQFSIRGFDIQFDQPWPEIDYTSAIQEQMGINVLEASTEEIASVCRQKGIAVDPHDSRGRLIDTLWKQCRKQIAGPAFLVNHPVEVSPLAKRNLQDPRTVERYQIIIAGSEQGNGYSELNDPIDQRERFEEQAQMRAAGDLEAQMHDEEFVEALEYGMPPTSGFGVSERLFSFLMNKPIRDCVMFPLLRPSQPTTKKSKELSLAVAVVNKGISLERWQEMNTIAHLTAAFGAREGKGLFTTDTITTKDDKKIHLNIQHAIVIKSAESTEQLRTLISLAQEKGVHIAEFTREMQETTNDRKVIEWTKEKDSKEIEYLGVLIFGEKKSIEELTSLFPLYTS